MKVTSSSWSMYIVVTGYLIWSKWESIWILCLLLNFSCWVCYDGSYRIQWCRAWKTKSVTLVEKWSKFLEGFQSRRSRDTLDWNMDNSVCRLLFMTARFENNRNARFNPSTRKLTCFSWLNFFYLGNLGVAYTDICDRAYSMSLFKGSGYT